VLEQHTSEQVMPSSITPSLKLFQYYKARNLALHNLVATIGGPQRGKERFGGAHYRGNPASDSS
jgi:hypothetical protein